MNGAENLIQFALGGLTLPPKGDWITVTERFRGRTVRHLCHFVTGDPQARYGQLTAEQRLTIALIAGKDAGGKPLRGHRHTYFLLWPDECDQPNRLIVWRRGIRFSEQEVLALQRAIERPMLCGSSQLYLVPLPLGTPPPRNLAGPTRAWRSVTPFVPPANRHRFRNGRVRDSETPERLAERLLLDLGLPRPQSMTASAAKAARLHRTRQSRIMAHGLSVLERPAYDLVIRFAEPTHGPILIGDSCHFGLGLFRTLEGASA